MLGECSEPIERAKVEDLHKVKEKEWRKKMYSECSTVRVNQRWSKRRVIQSRRKRRRMR